MIAARVAALFVLACFALPGPVLHAGEPDRWLEARTTHFVVTSNAGEEQARRVSLELERVRTMLQRTLANVR